MDGPGGRSAIVVPIALPAPLEGIRIAHVLNAPLGVPAHVTLMFPFVPASSIEADVLARAAAALAGTSAFEVQFREVTSFDPGPTSEGVVWLAPDPPAPFIAMTESISAAFPGYLPYEGLHDEVIPHLTLAERVADRTALEMQARPHLPFKVAVASAVLLAEAQDGRWDVRSSFPLG